MSNTINYSKTFHLDSGEKPPEGKTWAMVVEETRLNDIKDILSFPAVLARNYKDYLTEADHSVDPPVYKWKEDVVNQLDAYYSSETKTFLKKRLEAEQNRVPLSRPITRHTSS